MDDDAVTIRLTHDQAFVLSDWLYQVMFRSHDLEAIIRDRAVWSPIHTISGTLDGTLTEIFMPDHTQRLEAAQKRLRVSKYGEADESAASSEDTDTAPQRVAACSDQRQRQRGGGRWGCGEAHTRAWSASAPAVVAGCRRLRSVPLPCQMERSVTVNKSV